MIDRNEKLANDYLQNHKDEIEKLTALLLICSDLEVMAGNYNGERILKFSIDVGKERKPYGYTLRVPKVRSKKQIESLKSFMR